MARMISGWVRESRSLLPLSSRSAVANASAWLAAELARVRPGVIVALGAMAAQTLFGTGFRLTRERGQWHDLGQGSCALATWHPSAILRMRGTDREGARAQLVGDLEIAASRLPDR